MQQPLQAEAAALMLNIAILCYAAAEIVGIDSMIEDIYAEPLS